MEDEKIPVNDGGGLYDNIGFIDSLTVDCNDLPRLLIAGHYVAFCAKLVEMVKKLTLLRDGVQHDIEERDKQIKEFQQQIERGG